MWFSGGNLSASLLRVKSCSKNTDVQWDSTRTALAQPSKWAVVLQLCDGQDWLSRVLTNAATGVFRKALCTEFWSLTMTASPARYAGISWKRLGITSLTLTVGIRLWTS